ncbi:MFS transporter [Candidatus Halocynthiibacter alkanivorans]|uniref:MFS transporter n=1 Tax=Candidatus Halocynthiibacter alkanivorans TaxID=2267619 RepID=UPI001358D0FE|nr:MFS transporter [Candidatus Halocynthiibacter alkanivorans]
MNNVRLLFVMEFFSGLSRGSYLVCIGWITLVVTEDVSRVGQVFIIAMLTNLFVGPFVGTLVDRHNRKYLVIFAHSGIALTLIFLALIWLGASEPNIVLLFGAVVAASALRMMHNSSHDGLIQAAVSKAKLMRTVARFRGVHLISTAIGTVLAGIVIERVSPAAGFLFSAGASLLLILPMIFVDGGYMRTNAPGVKAFWTDLRGGVQIFRSNRALRMLALLAGVSLPIGQLSNAILSSLIYDDLGKGSQAFGIVDAAWPLGGMFAAALLSFGIRRLTARNMEYWLALFAGISTVALSLGTSIPTLAIIHGAMGMTVWMCRIVIDGRILQICTAENVGRTKVGIDMAFSLSALIMCFSPTLISLPSTATYFLFWGSFMILVSGLMLAFQRSILPQTSTSA